MSDPRRVAVQALLHQEQAGYANLVLDGVLSKTGLMGRDRAFAAALFYGTVERLNTLDFCLDQFSKRPVDKLDPPVRAILRSGLYQARYMQVPVPAAVDQSVRLTKAMGKSSAAGMVNAVLRRAAVWDFTEYDFSDKAESLSARYSVSRAVALCLLQQYPDRAESILQASFCHPATDIRVNVLKTDAEMLSRRLTEEGALVRPSTEQNCLHVTFRGSPSESAAFREGLFHPQSLPSQLAAAALQAKPGQKVVDLCAAPGGKSLVLAQCMQNSGRLYSCDAAQNRLSLIQTAFARMGVTNATVLGSDARIHLPQLEQADRVLCDVPCSGLGVLAKKPDIRYKTLEGLNELNQIQRAILDNGASYLKSGGRLVYSTCTILKEENQQTVRMFLQSHPDFHPAEAVHFPGAEDVRPGSLFVPCDQHPDGFYIAVLERDG